MGEMLKLDPIDLGNMTEKARNFGMKQLVFELFFSLNKDGYVSVESEEYQNYLKELEELEELQESLRNDLREREGKEPSLQELRDYAESWGLEGLFDEHDEL